MAVRVSRGQGTDIAPGWPEPADLADLWLGHALSSLFDACEVPLTERPILVESGAVSPELRVKLQLDTPEARLARLDSCRLAVLFAALAVEARLDRLLRRCDATDWPAVAHLAPVERFRIARRLLDGVEPLPEEAGLDGFAVELFDLRNELVDAVGRPGAAMTEMSPEFSPSRASAMVSAGARLCDFLAMLAGGIESATARIVLQASGALSRRAAELTASGSRRLEWDSGADVDFPPDLIGS